MRFNFSFPGGAAVICMITATQAHTWLEELRLIASNGAFTGAIGYPRGFVPRSGNPDQEMVYKIPQGTTITPNDRICNPKQDIGAQTPGFPALTAAPKDQVALLYKENGHVTKLEQGRPVGGGYVFIYGTKKPSNDDTYLGIHRVWNAAGTGGDKRGKLLATRHYDDGRCYQVNPSSQLALDRAAKSPIAAQGEDLKCQSDVELPEDAGTSGTYTLYWVWEWPTVSETGEVVSNQSYTGCVDIKMTSKRVADAGVFVANQPYDSMAIQEQINTPLLVNPTAPFKLNTVSIFNEQKMPLTTPVPNATPTAAPSASEAPSDPAASPSNVNSKPPKPVKTATKTAPKGFVTVTVTREPQEQPATVTVTEYLSFSPTDTAPSQTEPNTVIATGTETLTPLPASDFLPVPTTSSVVSPPGTSAGSSPSSPIATPTGRPVVRPFLPAPGTPVESRSSSPIPLSAPSTKTTAIIEPSTTSKSVCSKTTPANGVYTETATPRLNGTSPDYRMRRRRRTVRI